MSINSWYYIAIIVISIINIVIIIVVNIFIIIIKLIVSTRLLSADKETSTIDFRLLHLDTSWSYLDSIWFLMVSIWAFGSLHLSTIFSVWWSVSCVVLHLSKIKHDTLYLVRLNLVPHGKHFACFGWFLALIGLLCEDYKWPSMAQVINPFENITLVMGSLWCLQFNFVMSSWGRCDCFSLVWWCFDFVIFPLRLWDVFTLTTRWLLQLSAMATSACAPLSANLR